MTEAEVRRRLEGRDDVELVEYAGKTKGRSRFRCPAGHEWEASVTDVFGGKGCRACSGYARVDEAEARRRLASREDVELVEYGGSSLAKSKFCCPEGHEWETAATNVFHGTGCRICSGYATVNETAARRRLADRSDVELVEYAGSIKRKSRFRCPEGHEWITTTADVLTGKGCGICAGTFPIDEAEARRRFEGRDDVELVEYAGTISGQSKFRCPEGHEWTAAVSTVTKGHGCAVCAGNRTITEDEIRLRLAERDDVELVGYAGSTHGASTFRCPEGHEWTTTAKIVLRGGGCRVCNHKGNPRIDEDEVRRRLEGRDDVELLSYGGYVNARSKFRCPQGHEWETTANEVAGGKGCRVCSGYATVDETEARRRLEGRDDVELVRYGGSAGARSTFRCPQGHEWDATAGWVIRGTGCAVCATYGFDPGEPAWIYVLQHDELLALKIGITNNPESRVDDQHRRKGWQSVKMWKVDGNVAPAIELAVIRAWRRSGLPVAAPRSMDGYTETVSMMSVEVDDVILEVERLIREASKTHDAEATGVATQL